MEEPQGSPKRCVAVFWQNALNYRERILALLSSTMPVLGASESRILRPAHPCLCPAGLNTWSFIATWVLTAPAFSFKHEAQISNYCLRRASLIFSLDHLSASSPPSSSLSLHVGPPLPEVWDLGNGACWGGGLRAREHSQL